MTDAERSLAAREGAYKSWARTQDRAARTAPARAALDAKWERLVDPDGTWDPKDRSLAADAMRKAHYTAMARKSVASRRSQKQLVSDLLATARALDEIRAAGR